MKVRMDKITNGDWFKELEKIYEERRKTIKQGENVIHLEYLGGLIPRNELEGIEKKLLESGIELSRFDKNGLPQNAFEDYLNVVFIAIQAPLINNILNSVVSNLVWENIKKAIVQIWKLVRRKKYIKFSSDSHQKNDVSFGFEVKLDENTGFNFRLNGNLSEEIILQSLDKSLDFLRKQNLNSHYKNSYFVTYNPDNENWSKLDIEEQIRKEVMNRTNSKKETK